MEREIAELVGKFENGRITRRELISSLSTMVAVAAWPSAGTAQTSSRPLRATAFNHVSFVVSDYARTRDFYADLLGLKVTDDDSKAKQCFLHLADGSFIAARNPTQPNVSPPLVNHFAVGIADWEKQSVEAELKRRGLKYREDVQIPADSFHLQDPDGYDLQLVNEKVKG
jgi:catechol 2,3-dioxygenase-like lactoylglutathione lyase family enzyme